MFDVLRSLLSATKDEPSDRPTPPERVVREAAEETTVDVSPETVSVTPIPECDRGQRRFSDTRYRRTLSEGQNAVEIAAFSPPSANWREDSVFVGARAVQHLPDILERMEAGDGEPFNPLGAIVVERDTVGSDKYLRHGDRYWCSVCGDVLGTSGRERVVVLSQRRIDSDKLREKEHVYLHRGCVDELSEAVEQVVENRADELLGAAL